MREKYTHIYDLYYWFNSLQIFMQINKHLKSYDVYTYEYYILNFYQIPFNLNTWMTFLVQMFTSNEIIVWYHIQMEINTLNIENDYFLPFNKF